jgi:hypothetical protein
MSPCKAFYDGHHIYFTLDAALSLYFGINPIDWRRESPSFIRRIMKYDKYGFVPIFPGLPIDIGVKQYRANGVMEIYRQHEPTRKTIGPPKYYYTLHSIIFVEENLDQDQDQHTENDYDSLISNEFGDTSMHAIMYKSLSLIIKDKIQYVPVYTTGVPISIIDDFEVVNIEQVLLKLITSTSSRISEFYFGDRRALNIVQRLGFYTSYSNGSKLKLLTDADLDTIRALNHELIDIHKTRTLELAPKIELVKENLKEITFVTSNPGAQFSAAFNPIIRKHPREFYGPDYQDFNMGIGSTGKLFILHLRMQRTSLFAMLSLDVIRLIFRFADQIYIESFFLKANTESKLDKILKLDDDIEQESGLTASFI